jgi:hypothetical protein
MKRVKPMISSVAAVALIAGLSVAPVAVRPAHAQVVQFSWQEPPHEYSDIGRQGFHAGIEAAHHDIDAGRPPDPRRHQEFRHPHLPPGQRDEFRHGFERGYHVAYDHRGDWGRPH